MFDNFLQEKKKILILKIKLTYCFWFYVVCRCVTRSQIENTIFCHQFVEETAMVLVFNLRLWLIWSFEMRATSCTRRWISFLIFYLFCLFSDLLLPGPPVLAWTFWNSHVVFKTFNFSCFILALLGWLQWGRDSTFGLSASVVLGVGGSVRFAVGSGPVSLAGLPVFTFSDGFSSPCNC